MPRVVRLALTASLLATTLIVGTTYAHEATEGPTTETTVQRFAADPAECAVYVARNPLLAARSQGCWIEAVITTTESREASAPLGVSIAAAYHGGGYVTKTTTVRLSGPLGVWWVEAKGTWRYNGNHIYEVDTWCPRFALGYTITMDRCGVTMRDDYPYLIYGADFQVAAGPFTFGHGMRMRVYSSGATCCLSSY